MRARELENEATRVMNDALRAIVERAEPLVIIDSPPGAGKTWFCERLIALADAHRLRVCYVTPKVEQGCDLARRLLEVHPPFEIDLLAGRGRTVPGDLRSRVGWSSDPAAVGGIGRLVISNPAMLAVHRDRLPAHHFDVLLVDEAYQVPTKEFLPIADLAARVVLVGDPGQLAPTITIDTSEFESAGSRIHWAAPREIRRLHPGVPVFRLPASRRLVEDTVRIVQPSFYPDLPFRSAAPNEERRLGFDALGMNHPIDRALDLLERGQSIVALVIPGEPPVADGRDPALEDLVAGTVQRLLQRGPSWIGRRRLDQQDVGLVDSHVLSGGAMRARLQERGLNDIRVATPELWQGQECPIMVAKHPLNVGRADPGAFDLDPGRFCVMLSRHQLACILVGRESIQRQLESYMHDTRPTPIGSVDSVWNGYRAHSSVWAALLDGNRVIRAA